MTRRLVTALLGAIVGFGVLGLAPTAGATPTAVALMNAGRARTGLPAVTYTEAQLSALAPTTAFVLAVNAERTVRGLRAFVQSAAVDPMVEEGNQQTADPPCIQAYDCLGRVWAGSGATGPEAVAGVYQMVYNDGWDGSTTTNVDCHYAGTANCTGHRRTLLSQVAYANEAVIDAVCTPTPRTVPGHGTTQGSCAATEWQVPTSQLYLTAYYAPGGIWSATSTGAVYPGGNAPNYGSMAGHQLNAPIIGIVATPDGGGYWLLGSDGGIFSFGDAGFYGSTGGWQLNAPVVGMATTSDGHGYWLVASDGGIFAFGDAPFRGSMGGQPLNRPVVTMTATGNGYYLMASDGGLFAFTVAYEGSTGGQPIPSPMVGLSLTPRGYDEVTQTGTPYVFT